MTFAVNPETATYSPSEIDRQVEQAFDRHKRGDLAHAASVYRAVLARTPDHARALHYMGLIAQQTGNSRQAVELLERAIASDPTDPRAYNHLGQIHARLNDKRAAAELFERALAIAPDHADTLNNLANVTLTRDLQQAIALYRRALELRPDSAAAAYNLAQALNEDHAFDEAVALFRRAIALDPAHVPARHNLALLLEQRGQFAEAIEQYLTVRRLDPRHAPSLANVLGVRDYIPDAAMVRQAEDLLKTPGGRDEDRIKLHRGLGKHYERSGDHERAFHHFSGAKATFSRTRPAFDLDAVVHQMARLKAAFTAATFSEAAPLSDSERPVFIVGLPRSGTTLTEQILASHPQVFGAGELPDIPRLVKMLAPDYPEDLTDLDGLAELADDYLAELDRLAGPAPSRVTDKMPLNSLHLGLIAKLFPKARIIHCRRDPRDVALSCFVELFELDQDFTTRFEDFGRYFLEHERLMDHWRAVLPMPIHELRYEALVADPEPVIRDLLAYCGLDWDPACLAFQETERTVQTPSRWQVRQPLYQTSIGRWRRYERHMTPLLELLGSEDRDPPAPASREPARAAGSKTPSALERPLFIVAAPRSGSTLLFEALAKSQGLCTVGGEAHWLVESLPSLRPGAPDVTSNRLTARHASATVRRHMVEQIATRLVDATGAPTRADGGEVFLEKTPKNALRIPFFNALFPRARFIFLWRDPRENISSIMEAWRSGRFVTYRGLDGFQDPWSLLLPPAHETMAGQRLEEIAAFQWRSTNTIALDDLGGLDRDRWTSVNYADLLADPLGTVSRLMDFARLPVDESLAAHLRRPLPASRYTQTAPAADKWRANAREIESVLPGIEAVWNRLRALG